MNNPNPTKLVWNLEIPTYLLLMHLSQLTHFVLPMSGFVIPLVMWIVNKNEDPRIDQHGTNIANWMISSFIYAVVFFVLIILVIGIPLLYVLGILALLFPFIGGLKAYKGELWRYPLSIRFFK